MRKFYEEIGLEKVSDDVFIYDNGRYRKVRGIRVRTGYNYLEKYDLFLVQDGDRCLLVEGITGEVICEGQDASDTIEGGRKNLMIKGLIAFEMEISTKVFKCGQVSPAYRIKDVQVGNLCEVCGENPPLPHERICYECMCVSPHETILKLLGRI